jgi:hypothetical protein
MSEQVRYSKLIMLDVKHMIPLNEDMEKRFAYEIYTTN